MLYILQLLIVFAVGASNIYWQWTPNPYLAAVIGVLVAIAISAFIIATAKLIRRLRQPRNRVGQAGFQ